MKSCYLGRNKERLAFFEKQALLIGYASFRYTIVTSTHHFATNAVQAPVSLRRKSVISPKKNVHTYKVMLTFEVTFFGGVMC